MAAYPMSRYARLNSTNVRTSWCNHVGSCHPDHHRPDRSAAVEARVGLESMAGNSQFRYDHLDQVARLDKRLFP